MSSLGRGTSLSSTTSLRRTRRSSWSGVALLVGCYAHKKFNKHVKKVFFLLFFFVAFRILFKSPGSERKSTKTNFQKKNWGVAGSAEKAPTFGLGGAKTDREASSGHGNGPCVLVELIFHNRTCDIGMLMVCQNRENSTSRFFQWINRLG